MKTIVYMVLAVTLFLTGCAFTPEAPFEPVTFSIEGKWINKRLKEPVEIDTTLVSSTARGDSFLIYSEAAPTWQVPLDRKEMAELISGLDAVPETLKAVSEKEEFIRPIFESTRNPQQRLIVGFYKEKTDKGVVASTFRIKDPKIPNSLYVVFFVMSPEKAIIWKEQLAKLLQNQQQQ